MRRFYRPFVPAGGLAFDIGAHTGNRLHAFLALGARVVAVEPQPELVARLERRFGKEVAAFNVTVFGKKVAFFFRNEMLQFPAP